MRETIHSGHLYFYSHAIGGLIQIDFSISTHTPHAGRDVLLCESFPASVYFYSHAPCGTWPPKLLKQVNVFYFYSHAPCGTWLRHPEIYKPILVISTHTPHAGRDHQNLCYGLHLPISTHTPHAGRDQNDGVKYIAQRNFYSHAPCGTWPNSAGLSSARLSFLLTRPMRDVTQVAMNQYHTLQNFYSHAPCGTWRLIQDLRS